MHQVHWIYRTEAVLPGCADWSQTACICPKSLPLGTKRQHRARVGRAARSTACREPVLERLDGGVGLVGDQIPSTPASRNACASAYESPFAFGSVPRRKLVGHELVLVAQRPHVHDQPGRVGVADQRGRHGVVGRRRCGAAPASLLRPDPVGVRRDPAPGPRGVHQVAVRAWGRRRRPGRTARPTASMQLGQRHLGHARSSSRRLPRSRTTAPITRDRGRSRSCRLQRPRPAAPPATARSSRSTSGAWSRA